MACHGTPRDPLFRSFNYHHPDEVRLEVESAGEPDFLFVGHTHLPCNFRSSFTEIINPGSVGQPRDKNPAAAYAVWENGQIHFKRADYDMEEVKRSFASSGLHHSRYQDADGCVAIWRVVAGRRRAQSIK